MRNALTEALAENRRQRRGALLVYLMVDAGRRANLAPIVRACRRAGVTGIELGFPFSDPIADGPVLQAAASTALENGTKWNDLLRSVRTTSRDLPTAVMTYANPVYHRGLERACREIARAGGSGLIIPDLALEESPPWRRAARKAGLNLVQMGSPATPSERARALAKASAGFFYLVSRFGTTGRGTQASLSMLRSLISVSHAARPELPVLMGFGVRRAADVGPIRSIGADGAIVGTAVEEILRRSTAPKPLEQFLRTVVEALGRGARSE